MQLSAHPVAVRIRAVLPAVGEIVWAVGSLWMSSTLLHNWADPEGYWRETDALAYALIAAVYLPLVLRRRHPLAVMVSTGLWVGTYFTLGYYHVVAVCGMFTALYTAASLRPRRMSLRCAAATLAVLLWGTRLAEPGGVAISAAFVTVATVVCWVAGDGSRRLRELTRQLRLEQEEKARRAVTEERIQIARELHDVIAHHVSVISVQTGLAGYVFSSDPPTARRALDTIGDSAREALAEMRRMLVVLREEDPARAAAQAAQADPGASRASGASGLGRLDELVRRVGEAGVPVDVRITGTAYDLPPGIDLCAYRVVQEALTNVIKHAPDARTTVRVHYAADEVRVRVKDDGSGRPRPRPAAAMRKTAGQGLIGMRERATIYHGTVTAEPAPEGGFEVSLRVPVPRAGRGA
ncbi:sensor histidine kinase [Streptomyces sp. NBC_01408]|uniref:sensor histidine kinase n=1 Tax=Streptomyces sp. NBC_01408 TaxID=2903855 RepID=UPI002250644A|nr:histidine kinase [Streptomyces sp. NBC_01408]MCX4695305.1 histidine kinase [Streptomyces sp. NBC_01408]